MSAHYNKCERVAKTYMTHQDVDVLAEWAVRMRLDNLLDCAAGVECLRHLFFVHERNGAAVRLW
jgi:hypothetical protein